MDVIHEYDQAKPYRLSWRAVTEMEWGDPVPPPEEAALSYAVMALKTETCDITEIASGLTEPLATLLLPEPGMYLVGIEVRLLYTGWPEPTKSKILWSDNRAACATGESFIVRWRN